MQPSNGGEEQQTTFGNAWDRHWYDVATQLCVRGMDAGLPSRVDRHRTNRLKALGNSIVPAVAYRLFEAIKEVDESHGQETLPRTVL
jgi:hypothetical protein